MSDILSLLKKDFTKLTPDNLYTLKRHWAKTLGSIPKDSEILSSYRTLLKNGDITKNIPLEKALMTRSVRTESGVTAFAVMTKPFICPGQCTFCPLEVGMPKSYLSDEPAAARARMFNFDPRLQIEARLEQLSATGHLSDKIELIVIGGTFSNYPESYKREFFKIMIDTINGFESKSLRLAQLANAMASRRIVGISIETRPDWIDAKEVKLLRELGVTKLQVGVQALDEQILKNIKRGHSLEAVALATELLKNAGFKVCYHFMPNLPGSTPEKDVEMASLMYEDPRFKPDFLKVYPVQVIPQTELFRQWERGEYQPYGDPLLKDVLKNIKKITPSFVRIDRLIRDISKKWVSAGTRTTNMRQIIQKELLAEGTPCQCIRCREIKAKDYLVKPKLSKELIETEGGKEYFLSYVYKDALFSLLRLRLPTNTETVLFNELKGAAIIREVHTFGRAVAVGSASEKQTQHRGLGTKLIAKAEELAKEKGFKKIAVISAIGTRDYYRKFGYVLKGLYMVKVLK
ncbi:MAG: elongator complex protein 3 [bacterium]